MLIGIWRCLCNCDLTTSKLITSKFHSVLPLFYHFSPLCILYCMRVCCTPAHAHWWSLVYSITSFVFCVLFWNMIVNDPPQIKLRYQGSSLPWEVCFSTLLGRDTPYMLSRWLSGVCFFYCCCTIDLGVFKTWNVPREGLVILSKSR